MTLLIISTMTEGMIMTEDGMRTATLHPPTPFPSHPMTVWPSKWDGGVLGERYCDDDDDDDEDDDDDDDVVKNMASQCA